MKIGDLVFYFKSLALIVNISQSFHSGKPYALIYMGGKIKFVSLKVLRRIS